MTCKKVSFATENDALYYVDKLQRTSTRQRIPNDTYLCPHCLSWHLTSKTNYLVLENSKLKRDIISLNTQIELLKFENEKLRQGTDKEIAKEIKILDRVQEFNTTVTKLNKTVIKLRKDNSTLISKLIQLEKPKDYERPTS